MNPSTMNGGITDPTTASLLSQLSGGGQQQPTPQAAPVAPQPHQSGNFLTRLLPTLGGIVGGIGGELVDPFGGGIVGAGLLSGAGKAAENAIEGKKVLQGNDITSALSGAAGQFGGALAGKALSGATGLVGNLVDKGAGKLVQGQFAPGTVTGNIADDLVHNYGVTDARQVGQIAKTITGSTEGNGAALTKGVEHALMKNGTPVDVGGISAGATKAGMGTGAPSLVNDLMGSETAIGDTAAKKISAQVGKSVQNMLGGPNGSVGSQLADPLDVHKQEQLFRSLASNATKGAQPTPEQAAVSRVYNSIADELHQRAFSPNGTAVPLTDDIKSKVIDGLAPIRDVNPTAYGQLIKEVHGADTAEDLKGLQSKWVGLDKALNITNKAADASGGLSTSSIAAGTAPVAGAVAKGVPGVLMGAGAAAIKSPTADRAGAAMATRLAKVLTNPTMKKILTKGAPVAGQVVAGAPNLVAPPVTGATPMGGMVTGNTMQPGQVQPGGAQSSPQTIAFQTALAGMADPYVASSYAPLLQSLLPGVQHAQTAQAALTGAEGAFQQAGGGQGLLGGLLSKLGGSITGGPAAAYSQQAEQLKQQLLALGVPASAIPQLTQTSDAANTNFSILQQLINSQGGGSPIMAQ